MHALLRRHRSLWSQRAFLVEVGVAFALLALGMCATYYANFYSTIRASNFVTDAILDNIPVINVGFVFNEGAWFFVAVLAALLLYEPQRIPFVLKSIALFIITRSFFITLTHLAPPPQKSFLDPTDYLYKISSGDDLFFSAHTGLPFLLAVIFWQVKRARYFFLASTLVGGGSVLLGHLHYSIDVFSALFIAFGVFHIALTFFPQDHRFFRHGRGDETS